MKEQNTNQMSTRQVIEIHRRAIGDMQKMCPYLLPSTALYAIVSGIVPYVTDFFSARILNELAGQRRPEERGARRPFRKRRRLPAAAQSRPLRPPLWNR